MRMRCQRQLNNLKAVGNGLTVFSGDRSANTGITGAAWGFEGVGLTCWCCFASFSSSWSAGSGNRCPVPVLSGAYRIHPSRYPAFPPSFLSMRTARWLHKMCLLQGGSWEEQIAPVCKMPDEPTSIGLGKQTGVGQAAACTAVGAQTS